MPHVKSGFLNSGSGNTPWQSFSTSRSVIPEMDGKLFSIQNETQKLYDPIILTGYWQRDLDRRRRGRSLARHRSRRPVATTLNFWRI